MPTQPDAKYTLTGRITNAHGESLEGLIVRAYDQDPLTQADPLGEEVLTDAEGRYKISFTESDFKVGGVERGGPDVFIRVYDGDELLGESPVKRNSRKRITIDVQVDYVKADPDEPARRVHGVVRDAQGELLHGMTVQAFDRDLRSEQTLGQSKTDKQGTYHMQYFTRRLRQREKGSADLVVKAFATGGELLATSPVLFNAPPDAEVNLAVPAEALQPPTLFEKIGQALTPLLRGLKLTELEEDKEHQDLSFLSGETGFEKQVLARFILAHKLASQGIRAEFWFVLLGGSFYEYTEDQGLEEQLETVLDALSSFDGAAVRKSLIRGFNEKEIPAIFQEKTDALVEAFLKFVANRIVGESAEPTFVRSVLEHAGITDARKQEKFARLFNEHKAITQGLLDTLGKDRSFKKAEIGDLRTSFQLAEMTQGDFSVVKMVKEEFGVRRPEQIRALARKSEAEWVKLVASKHAAGEIKLPIEVSGIAGEDEMPQAEIFGRMLERQFREAFPTTAFAGGLERALNNGGAPGLRQAEALAKFLDRHEDFELLNTPVDDFLKKRVNPEFRALAQNEGFKQEVKAVQRVFKLAPTFEATNALLADDLHSAQRIYRLGESEFVRRYAGRAGFTAESARLAWRRAADTHAAVLTIVADLKALDPEGLPLALQNGNEALHAFPNWENLFKSGDLCECEHCRSVLSPAAYFADLLMFLKDRSSTKPKPSGGFFSVKDILFQRRADLGFLELNCDNALTTLPYIDVVCEVLEDVIAAGDSDLELTGFAVMPSDPAAAKTAVATAFAARGISLGADFSLSQVSSADPDRWVAHGDDVTYLLKKKATPSFFAEILRNTKASAAELRAYPQYVNSKAYQKLRKANHPLTLPFDLFAEEVRAAFKKSNLQRWDLMQTLRGSAAPNNPTDGEIAAEYFGISADPAASFDEKRLILVADLSIVGQQAIWGESGASWLTELGNVKNFLRKTGLEYNELLALLDLKFINPTGDIAIHHLDASCDTEKKVIQILDATKLDRIHRFLRLWRKLDGWKMWEFDLIIRHPRIGNGALDDQFLARFFYFSRLRKRLGQKATTEQVCTLFGDLNTETRFTKMHEKREDALYQNLFLNKRLINPLVPAFRLDAGTGDLPTGETISSHHAVVLAALGIRESDLILLKGLAKSSGLPYITDDLTLSNLSFLWRHSWLAKQLKFKVEEWKILLKLIQQDIGQFTDPQAAWEFVEIVDHLKAAGFTPDALNWLLDADRTSKAATKEADVTRFLTALRKELQAIQAENDPSQYDFLYTTPPTDVDSLSALLTSLLQKLNRDEGATQFFIAVLRNEANQEKRVEGLPTNFDFPAAITNAIRIRYEPALYFRGKMTSLQRTTLLTDPSLAAVTGLPAYQQAIQELFQQPGRVVVRGLPTGFTFPPSITGAPDHISIRYEPVLRFTGLMSEAEQTTLLTATSLSGVTGIVTYKEAIAEFFNTPRLALKFFEAVFTAPLASLPEEVDFTALPDAALARKISYDAEQRLLRFAGILSSAEKAALDALSSNIDYRNAVSRLANEPGLIAPPDDRIWMLAGNLQLPLVDHLAENLATATKRALGYLARTLSERIVVQQGSAQLGLTEAQTLYLLASYPVLPDTLLAHLTGAFATTAGVVDYSTLKTTFDAWFWANRVATILKKWKIPLTEWEKLSALTAAAQLLDFGQLPLDSSGAIASLDRFLRVRRLLHLRDSLPETQVTLLEVLQKLEGGAYATVAEFAADVERLNGDWLADNVEALVASLDLVYPTDYLLAESWERLRRAFYFIDSLNSGAGTVKGFAAAAMNDLQARTLLELLRSKFGTETWLTLSAEIQDVLRERKRDALAAYLLAGPKPADAPTTKWENTNDLYAYYLLDVEMSTCQLTSRLVQGSGSVQLFVQRCFMGLEPEVRAIADGDDGDSAWRWWKWMYKYRLWEANRKVFLWPENWIEPELKRDRSEIFKDLENELLQNEVNQHTVEAAFCSYLEKLDGVAQLEIAGFYQEDDGDDTIIHVFGRTPGAEPHLYYYRRYDYGEWTPWEKVELDIQGDYLVPAVIHKRLFLFWPVFTEEPDEASNDSVSFPNPLHGASIKKVDSNGDSKIDSPATQTMKVQKTKKRLRLQMAVSDYDYRQRKWRPKRISKDSDQSFPFSVEIVRKHYRFFPIDRSEADGRFCITHQGSSLGSDGNFGWAGMFATFEVASCTGAPEKIDLPGYFRHALRPERASTGNETAFLKWVELGQRDEFGHSKLREDAPQNDFTLESVFFNQSGNLSFTPVLAQTPVLEQTPWFFKTTPPLHLSYLDKLMLDGQLVPNLDMGRQLPIGNWLPFFYNDKKRTFFVLPSLWQFSIDRLDAVPGSRKYYPEIKRDFRQLEEFFAAQVQTWLDSLDLSALTPAQRQQIEQNLRQAFPDEALPPYTDTQAKALIKRFLMRFFHWQLGVQALGLFRFRQFHFKTFYHPFVCDFAKLVYHPLKGIPALMTRETQLRNSGFSFRQSYQPTSSVVDPTTEDFYPTEIVDFSLEGAYSPYNWELFFHVPLLIANALSRNQRFEEARDWYHFIFNPLGVESPVQGGSPMSKYWITKPFFETTDPQYVDQRIDIILRMLGGDTSAGGSTAKEELEKQVLDWRTNPFEPHRIAKYRTVAYQKMVVMKYLENLIAWGDYLFRQDSMESINEATQLYILAAEILGPRPKKVPPQAKPPVESFNELETELDAFSNALVEVENLIPPLPGNGPSGADPAPLPTLYFCIPQNDKMLGYWDTVADRLYKIRHCMNIEGVVRQLALFEPPIDPGALVKAVAAGVDISSALSNLNAPTPLYRFNVLLQKANEVCNDVKALGGALLAALEKKDAEALGLLRQGQEIRLLEAVKAVREQQIEEAKESLAGLQKSKESAQTRESYYARLSQELMNPQERLHLEKLAAAHKWQTSSQLLELGVGVAALVPQLDQGVAGAFGSPVVKASFGGVNLSTLAQSASRGMSLLASMDSYNATKASIKGGHDRRKEEWDFQKELAGKEIEQLDKSIAAAELRIAMTEKELENHNLQTDNAKAIDDFMRSKYTNEELYQWQVGQVSAVYFQSYKLAHDMAKRAERCFRFELGLQDSSYIRFGYWDSLKKGLLSGEKLQYDLRRLEAAYLEQNRREFELTKHVSLVLLDPLALVKLRETGRCFFRLPEEIFDLDYPGHYFRRIKSLSLTLPCVVGPYTTISCTLRLLKNSIRINTTNGDSGYARNTDEDGLPADDPRFIENNVPVKGIAASNAQNDSGVFELSFRDERYLPFEGAGAISEWSLELFNDVDADFGKPLRQFDYGTISDVILHVKYTAREDPGPFKQGAIAYLREHFSREGATPSLRLLDLRQEFPTQWNRFLHPTNPANGNVFELEILPNLFPFRDAGKELKINTIYLLARCTGPGNYNVVLSPPLPEPPPAGSNRVTLTPNNQYGGLYFGKKPAGSEDEPLGIEASFQDPPAKWLFRMTRPGGGNLQENLITKAMEVEDLLLVVSYEWE